MRTVRSLLVALKTKPKLPPSQSRANSLSPPPLLRRGPSMKSKLFFVLAAVLVAAVAFSSLQANAAATLVIVNNDAPNVGFNDPTPVAPVGGNSGTTLGQ